MTAAGMLELAERCERLDGKIQRAILNETGLSAGGQAIAIAMLVTLEAGLLLEVAAALRTSAVSEGEGHE